MVFNWYVTTTFICYSLVMLFIGYWAYTKTNSATDYFLGGRSLGPLPSALSAGASDMSGWLLLGLPGYAYTAGIEASWIAIGLFIGSWLNWKIVAPKLRIYSELANDSITIPDYFENRFHDQTQLLRFVSAFFILMFFLFYTSSGLVAGGKLFETVFGLDYDIAVVVGAIVVVSYTLFGGFWAVSLTDVVQGLLMLIALLLTPMMALYAVGGLEQLNIKIDNPYLLDLWVSKNGDALSWIAILSFVGWGLGYFGQPHVLARFMAIKTVKDIPRATTIAVSWAGLSLLGSLSIGIIAIVFFPQTLADAEKVFILLVQALFNPMITGILLAAILAAIMSTADSQLLVCSSALAEDFYKPLFNKRASAQQLLRISRISVVALSIIATVIALNPDAAVLDIVSYAWAGFGAAFGPAIIFSLHWSRMTWQGALAGIIVGSLTVVIWHRLSDGIFDLYEIVPGFIFASASIVVASLLSPPPSKDIHAQFKQVIHNLNLK